MLSGENGREREGLVEVYGPSCLRELSTVPAQVLLTLCLPRIKAPGGQGMGEQMAGVNLLTFCFPVALPLTAKLMLSTLTKSF